MHLERLQLCLIQATAGHQVINQAFHHLQYTSPSSAAAEAAAAVSSSFIHSVSQSFIHSFIHSLIHSFILLGTATEQPAVHKYMTSAIKRTHKNMHNAGYNYRIYSQNSRRRQKLLSLAYLQHTEVEKLKLLTKHMNAPRNDILNDKFTVGGDQ